MRSIWFWGTVTAIVLGILVRMSLFTVDPTEFVYVTQLGAPVGVYDGGVADDAGLHFRWPWPIESLQRLDRRLQHFDLPPAEVLTRDPEAKAPDKTLTVEAYVCWRLLGTKQDPTAVDRFIRTLGTAERARDILGQRITSQLGALLGRRRMDDLVSTDRLANGSSRVEATLAQLRTDVMDRLIDEAR